MLFSSLQAPRNLPDITVIACCELLQSLDEQAATIVSFRRTENATPTRFEQWQPGNNAEKPSRQGRTRRWFFGAEAQPTSGEAVLYPQLGGSMKPHNIFAGSGMHPARSGRQACRSLVAAAVLLMTALVLSSCGSETKAEKEKAAAAPPPPVPVVVTPAVQKTVPIYSEFTARADARDTVEVRARVEAFLEGI